MMSAASVRRVSISGYSIFSKTCNITYSSANVVANAASATRVGKCPDNFGNIINFQILFLCTSVCVFVQLECDCISLSQMYSISMRFC
jgi:hypothetical protein